MGIFHIGKNKISFPGKFLRGIDHCKKNYFVGLSAFTARKNRKKIKPQIGIINKKTKKSLTALLPQIGAICAIRLVE